VEGIIKGYDKGGRPVSGILASEENCPPEEQGGTPTVDPTDPEALSKAHHAAAGDRTNPAYGGNCDPDQHDRLSQLQDDACGLAAQLGSCLDSAGKMKPNLTQSMIQLRRETYGNCANARANIMNKCFAGGDNNHRNEERKMRDVARGCASLIP
jgi:hypothetical protein